MFTLYRSFALFFVLPTLGLALPLRLRNDGASTTNPVRGYDIPIVQRKAADVIDVSERDGITGTVGLGDNRDLWVSGGLILLSIIADLMAMLRLYTVPIKLGETVMPVHLGQKDFYLSKVWFLTWIPDTGSSDLWVISDDCESELCNNSDLPRYSLSSFNASGPSVTMYYGDSKTGTYAGGPIGNDVTTIAGVAVPNQQFAAINSTSNPTIQYGAAGIFGLGFPSGR
jgi:hypothetical protein